MQNPFKRWRWPWDGATTIALVALVVSTVQFVVSTPVIYSLWWAPHLVLLKPKTEQADAIGYPVLNAGRASAHNIELELNIAFNDYIDFIMVTPNRGAVVSDIELGKRLVYPRLEPGEMFMLMIALKDDVPAGMKTAKGKMTFPIVFRSDEGPGEIREVEVDLDALSGPAVLEKPAEQEARKR